METNNLFSDADLTDLTDDSNAIVDDGSNGGGDDNPDDNGDNNPDDGDNPPADDDNNPDDNSDNSDDNDNPNDLDDELPVGDIVAPLIEKYGIELDENEVIDESPEGLETVIEKIKADTVQKVLTKYQPVAELFKHLANGYSIDSFMQEAKAIDYSKVEIKEVDIENGTDEDNEKTIDSHTAIIKQNLLTKGLNEKQIERFIKSSVEEGTTADDAKESLKELQSRQATEIQARKDAEKAVYDRQVQEAQETLKEINSTIEKGAIGGFKIPKTDIAAFKDYVSKFDDKGLSQRDMDSNELTLEQSLLLDYILFKKFKVAGLEKESSVKGKQDAADNNKPRKAFSFGQKSSNDTNTTSTDEDDLLKLAFNKIA